MDKPSDRVFRPFVLPGDEAQIEEDWRREHPEEARMIDQFPGGRSPEERSAERFERAQADKARLMAGEGGPASSWEQHDVDLAPSSAEQRHESDEAHSRRLMRGGLSDSSGEMPARATEDGRLPFKLRG
jgi:hypothetical protein